MSSTLPAANDLHWHPGKTYQTMEGFGASDAWNGEFIGRYWSAEEKEKAARLLFSDGWKENGEPEGAALSVWRVNIGAGSAEQGEDSGISNPTRRASSYLDTDGEGWDWTRSPGQRWFLEQAKQFGVDQFVAFSISPHVSQTKNGLGRATGEIRSNLREDAYGDYAAYLVRVLRFYRDRMGVDFDYLSPLNEPQYPWNTAKQEGCSYTNAEIARLVRVLDNQLQGTDLAARLLIPEAAEWLSLTKEHKDPRFSNQLEALFSPESPHYIGDRPRLAPVAAAHSYWLNRTTEQIRETRTAARDKAQSLGIGLRQTEYSLIDLTRIRENQPQTRWDIALFIGKVILADLKYANVTGWSFWVAFEQDIWDYRNQFQLIRIEAEDEDDLSKGGHLVPEKNLWVMAHFSRFVRPGWQRIGLQGADDLEDLNAVAFQSPDGKETALVVLNFADEPRERRLSAGMAEWASLEAWTTTAGATFRSLPANAVGKASFTFPPRSISTVLIQSP
ncbi:MAG: beta-glycosidase [Verrucomicrobia bacterium]|nr:beta-glycosidase [Verrucomicrobiota bacterium]